MVLVCYMPLGRIGFLEARHATPWLARTIPYTCTVHSLNSYGYGCRRV